MSFGLKNGPPSFQKAVGTILSRVKRQFALAYLYEIVFYLKSVTEQLGHIRTLLTLLRKDEVAVELLKFSFPYNTCFSLGLTIRSRNLAVSYRNCEAVRESLPPMDQTELKSFLAMRNVYRLPLSNMAQTAAQLGIRARKNQPFKFEPSFAELDIFQELKDRFMSPLILALPRHGQRYTLDTEAWDYHIRCAVL